MSENIPISERLRHLLSKETTFKFRPDIQDDVCLKDAGVLDSFGLIALVIHLEGEFGIRVRPEDATFEKFRSIMSIAEYVQQKLDANHRR